MYTLSLITALFLFGCSGSEGTTNTNGTEDKSVTTSTADLASENNNENRVSGVKTIVKSDGKDLIGEWVWVKTSCCGRMTKDTSPSEEDPQKIISFDEKGAASYYSKGSVEKMDNFTYSTGMMGTQTTVKIGDLQPAIYSITYDDKLVLNWGYMDLQIEYYERVEK